MHMFGLLCIIPNLKSTRSFVYKQHNVLFCRYIIGKKGETRRRLESDTKTSISIPKQGVEGEMVRINYIIKLITGSHKAAVSSAVTRVELLVESFRKKQPFTHFLSFPLSNPKIQEEPCKASHDNRTLALLNETEVRKACEHLQQCQNFIRDITEGNPLALEVTGIEYMNDDPAMVDVLYAKVNTKDKSDKLQLIADRLVEHFVSAGLMKFGAYRFGEFGLNTVLLSQRYSSDCTGYYTSAGSANFS
ncbi:hypothetical protein F7725_014517 [Dissostichus mawsoni]|uniref:K Homology domain-containing protein n=1 Tax=Dissostichus mawsoni TaxID=36200 RepID=A0A7J5YYJ9_DISMA|nr:hypothetical protein F7725_014517 [Dissostichus mawsoni]